MSKRNTHVAKTEKNQDLINKAKALDHVPWCEEYERMISGMSHKFLGTPELEAHFKRTQRLCRQYNDEADLPEDASLTSMIGQSREKLAGIVGHLGKHSYARAPFNASMGCNIYLGDNVKLNSDFQASDLSLVTIKDRTLIGPSCRILTLAHSLNYLDRRTPDEIGRPVEIGEDCWIGIRVTILSGVTIGKGCMVAAGAVVAKDVAPFNLVGGVPARVIRHLGNPEEPGSQGDGSDSIVNGISGDNGVEAREESPQEGKAGASAEPLPEGDGAEGT